MDDKALPPAPSEERRVPVPAGGFRAGPMARVETRESYMRGIGSILRRQWWLVAGCTAAAGIAAAVITRHLPRTYESAVTVLVELADPRRAPTGALALLEREGLANTADTEIQLLQSRSVVEPAVQELDLHVSVVTDEGPARPSAVFADFEASPRAQPGLYRVQPATGRFVVTDAATGGELARGEPGAQVTFAGLSLRLPEAAASRPVAIRVEPLSAVVPMVQERIGAGLTARDASVIRLTCTGPTPGEAQDLCRAISQGYMNLRSQMQTTEASTTAAFLREQSEQMRLRLRAAEDSLESYGRRNRVVALDTRAEMEVQQFGGLRAERDQLEAERRALSELLATMEADPRGDRKYRDLASYPSLVGNRSVSSLIAGLVELENQRSELALRRTERNPDLAALDTRIAEMERELLAIASSYRQGLDLRIRSFDRTLAETGSRLSVIPTQQVELARLERQVGLLGQLYGELETRLREAEIAEAVDLPSVQVVDAASLPLTPSSPRPAINVGLGLFFGASLGLLLAFYREFSDTRLREAREVSQHTGLPILGLIPTLDRPGPIMPVLRQVDVARGTELAPTPSREEDLLLEAFGSLSADLRFIARTLDGRRLRSVAITSPMRGEGKTMVACNLAIARASSSGRTLLVDADLRAGGVSPFFQLPSDAPGLADVLVGRASPESVWQRLRLKNKGELWVVPAGKFTPEAAGRLGPPSVGELISSADAEFDLVIIDTPPLCVITDAATIASMVDAVVIVIRRGRTDREALNLTLERLERANAHVVGVVLNDFEAPAYYSSYYSYASSDAG